MPYFFSKALAFLKPKRRWFQYSLRTLFLLVTIFAIWLGFTVHRVNRQRDAVAAIREMGGWIRYDFQISSGKFDPKAQSSIPNWLLRFVGYDFFHDVVEVNLVYNDDGPQRLNNPNVIYVPLKCLGGLPRLKALFLYDAQATDQGLAHVGRLKHLEKLYMWDASEVSDIGVQHLRNLSHLKDLHINNSNITDEALRIFGGLTRLETLSLQGNCFTDRGLKSLRRLTRLRQLCIGLGDTRITDEGLLHLHGLKNLSLLELQKSPVTQAGLAKLQQALPKVGVVHEDTGQRPVPRIESAEGDGPQGAKP